MEKLSKKRRKKKKIDQKEQKGLHLLGIEPKSGVYHLEIRSYTTASIYVQIRTIHGRQQTAYGHTDTNTVRNIQILYRYW